MQLPATKTASDANSDVLLGKSQLLVAVRAFRVHVGIHHGRMGRIKAEISRAEFALDALTDVFPIYFQFLCAMGAPHKQSGRCYLNHGINLLKWEKNGNLNAVSLQLGV